MYVAGEIKWNEIEAIYVYKWNVTIEYDFNYLGTKSRVVSGTK
jgi:hypothetical protein